MVRKKGGDATTAWMGVELSPSTGGKKAPGPNLYRDKMA